MPWRLMTPGDYDAVKSLADAIHVSHPEDLDVLVERQRIYPEGCLVLIEAGQALGYTLSHPWRLGEAPALNTRLGRLPDHPTTYYIHDVALAPGGRGKGHATGVAERMAGHARRRGFGTLSLVAVNNSRAVWEKLGFREAAMPDLGRKLFSYGDDALLMVRDLRSGGQPP